MDLGAYANIGEDYIEQIVKENNIEVPRLRGYRLMAEEEKVDLKTLWTKKDDAFYAEELCTSIPFWSTKPRYSESSERTDRIRKKFLYPDADGCYFPPSGIRWDKIHGWKRRVLKTYIKNRKNEKIRQYKIWNKYVGRKDILYIHARIGGGNWPDYYDKVVNQPWFIEKVDDSFDCTYCDIYAKIEVKI